jgi:probable HAF family extracellular repeat protein
MHIYGQVSRAGLPVQAGGFIEALEPRLLLAAGAPSPPPDGVTIIGNHAQAVKAFAWADVDGDTVTPLLTGKGYVELNFKSGLLSKIVLNGTDAATSFSLRVKAAGQVPGCGIIGMGEVADDGKSSLNTLDLSAAVLSGTIQMTGTLKTLKLGTYSGPGISLGGAAADKLSVTARVVDSAAALTFGGQIASLTVTSWAGGLIAAVRIGRLSVTGGDFGADLDIGAGGIGTINVRGGNLTGTVTTDGAIGNITVTGVASFDAGASSGLVSGGAIRCPLITAGAVKGKSIGNITTSGGELAGTISATGSIGNLNVKSLRYKAAILEQPVLDASGEPRIDFNGMVVVRKVMVYNYAWGGMNVDLDTPSKLGNVAVSGGSLSGTLHAGGGMGNVLLEAILRKRAGTEQGIPYASAAEDIIGGDLSAQFKAEPGDRAIGIASITVVGGSLTGSARVMGKIGGITTKCYGLVDEQSQTAALVGGNLTAGLIQASAIGNISVRGELSGTIIATSTIGNISVQAGSMASDLTARDAIGNISVRALIVDARIQRWWDTGVIGGGWNYTTWPSVVFGGGLQVTIHLGHRTAFLLTPVTEPAPISPALAGVQYTVTDLGALPGETYSEATGINNAGQVVGRSTPNGNSHAFLYSGGVMSDLGTLGGSYSEATGINNAGQIVGTSYTTGGLSRAFLYSNGTMTDLGILPSGSGNYANGINDAGQIVGQAYTAFLYSNGSMTDLGTLPGGTWSAAYAINSAGQVVGYSTTTGPSPRHAFLYSNGSMTDLETLGGVYSYATGINNAGQIVGYSYTTGDAAIHAFLYSDGVMTDLGTVPGGSQSYAHDINDAGQIVGNTDTGAFLYNGGVMTDLNSLIDPASGWTLQAANAINDNGQIVGYGIHFNRSAKMGTITGTGVGVTVSGEVPFYPARITIVSRPVRYVYSWSCTGQTPMGRPIYSRDWATIGGTVDRTGLYMA